MSHWSENAKPLRFREKSARSPDQLASAGMSRPCVWTLILPYDPMRSDYALHEQWLSGLRRFVERAHPESTIAILSTPRLAADIWPELENSTRFQLWVAVKLKKPTHIGNALPMQHAALLLLTRYNRALSHTKTRIAYTYCPACDRTTKDYGGKKHTYHKYGTLMSDIWRDISCSPTDFPRKVVQRLCDIFGLEPYRELYVIDMRKSISLRRTMTSQTEEQDSQTAVDQRVYPVHTLLNGDCMRLLKSVPSNSIDFCFADPPYNLRKKYDNWNDTLDSKDYFAWCDEWLSELARVLKPGRTLAVLNIPVFAIRHFSRLKNVLVFQNWIVWEGLSLPVRMIMPAHYAIICFSKGRPRRPPGLQARNQALFQNEELCAQKEFYCARAGCVRRRELSGESDRIPITDLWWDIHRLKHNTRRVDHPCQLPPALMRRLIAFFTAPGEIVLDPFNGAGTTTLAAEQLGRTFIGIELSKKYHELATQRHEELRIGLDPFRKSRVIPTAKNSPVRRLKKRRYGIPKKTLQLEIKRVADELGHMPSREEAADLCRYPISLYDECFINWAEACAAARTTGMSELRKPRRQKIVDGQLTLF